MGESELEPTAETWLRERYKDGNWFDVSETDEIPAAMSFEYRALLDMFRLFFSPEIRCRLKDGRLDQSFVFQSAQVVFIEDKPHKVRLNGEMRGLATVQLDRPVDAGEQLTIADLNSIQAFDLELDELDYGHFTTLWTGSRWGLFFDFSTGRAKVAEILHSASEFLATADYALANDLGRAALDNLFSASKEF